MFDGNFSDNKCVNGIWTVLSNTFGLIPSNMFEGKKEKSMLQFKLQLVYQYGQGTFKGKLDHLPTSVQFKKLAV